MSYRIVRRAFGRYEIIENNITDLMYAINRAMKLEFENNNGEYFVRRKDEPDWEYAPYLDQGVSD